MEPTPPQPEDFGLQKSDLDRILHQSNDDADHASHLSWTEVVRIGNAMMVFLLFFLGSLFLSGFISLILTLFWDRNSWHEVMGISIGYGIIAGGVYWCKSAKRGQSFFNGLKPFSQIPIPTYNETQWNYAQKKRKATHDEVDRYWKFQEASFKFQDLSGKPKKTATSDD